MNTLFSTEYTSKISKRQHYGKADEAAVLAQEYPASRVFPIFAAGGIKAVMQLIGRGKTQAYALVAHHGLLKRKHELHRKLEAVLTVATKEANRQSHCLQHYGWTLGDANCTLTPKVYTYPGSVKLGGLTLLAGVPYIVVSLPRPRVFNWMVDNGLRFFTVGSVEIPVEKLQGRKHAVVQVHGQ